MLKSKTFWGGLVAIATGTGAIFTGNPLEGGQMIITGLLAIFLKDAITKTQAPK